LAGGRPNSRPPHPQKLQNARGGGCGAGRPRTEIPAGRVWAAAGISYLSTGEKGIYLFIYLVLDEYSRKVLAWRISWVQTSAEAAQLLETALIQENVLDLAACWFCISPTGSNDAPGR
jgi:transposase InsO family protein